MKFDLEKWIDNKTGYEFKRIFNDNVDKINGFGEYLKTKFKAIESRIDNLVINSGGDSPNEVVDLRTNSEGKKFGSAQARVLYIEETVKENMLTLMSENKKLRNEVEIINNLLNELYGGKDKTVDIFVSEKVGDDKLGDGTEAKPYKTIQRAVDTIPMISGISYTVNVEPGVYLEDVMIRNLKANRFELVATNLSTSSQHNDTGVFLRSVAIVDCNMYSGVRGFTQTDVANSRIKAFIEFSGAAYGIIDRCRAVTNTKTINGYIAFYFDRSSGHIYTSLTSNQHIAVSAEYTTELRMANDVSGVDNEYVYRADSSTIYTSPGTSIKGKNEKSLISGGQVL